MNKELDELVAEMKAAPPPSALNMELRDYFAAQALSGLLADSDLKVERLILVREAFIYADLMLQERSK